MNIDLVKEIYRVFFFEFEVESLAGRILRIFKKIRIFA